MVTLTATVKNNGDTDTVVDAARLGSRGQYEILTTDKDEVLESGTWEPDKGKEFEPHPVPLRAHHSFSRFVSLTHEVAELLRNEGRMRLLVEFCDPAFGGDTAKPRCVSSNGIIITMRKDAGVRQMRPR